MTCQNPQTGPALSKDDANRIDDSLESLTFRPILSEEHIESFRRMNGRSKQPWISWSKFVDHHLLCLAVVVILTALLLSQLHHIKTDLSFNLGVPKHGIYYDQYNEFIDKFGYDEFVLVVIKVKNGQLDSEFVQIIDRLPRDLRDLEMVKKVISIMDVKVFRKKNGVYGLHNLFEHDKKSFRIPSKRKIEDTRKIYPAGDLILSADGTAIGIIVQLDPAIRYGSKLAGKLRSISDVVKRRLPSGTKFVLGGSPVMREAALQSSIESGTKFILAASIVSVIVLLLVFRNVGVAFVCVVVSGMSALWLVCMMAIFSIPISVATSISFGIIVIVTIASNIHIIIHYFDYYWTQGEKKNALRSALNHVGKACFFCSLTTAAGFATITVSDIPLLKQLGITMSVGVLISLFLTMLLSPSLILMSVSASLKLRNTLKNDWLEGWVQRLQLLVFNRNKTCVMVGFSLVAILIIGIPSIQVNSQLLSYFYESDMPIKDLRFAEKNLGSLQSLEIVAEGPERFFLKPSSWKTIADISNRLESLEEIKRIDSLLPVLQQMHRMLSKKDASPNDLYTNPQFVPQAFVLLKSNAYSRMLFERYIDSDYSAIRLSARIRGDQMQSIPDIIRKVESTISNTPGSIGSVHVTGDAAYFALQCTALVRSQVLSLILALCLVTILMGILLRSVRMGLLSLIPNVFPILLIFGLMGWFTIRLDQTTIFVAAMSIGISVDGTVHYLTQLRRSITEDGRNQGIYHSIKMAHQNTARALLSTTAVLFLGFITLIFTPFRPYAYFGVLASFAMFGAVFGDLVFMPSLIQIVPWLKKQFE